jgi:hypothetical protein
MLTPKPEFTRDAIEGVAALVMSGHQLAPAFALRAHKPRFDF